MKWASFLYTDKSEDEPGDLKTAVAELTERLKREHGDEPPDLLIGFVSPHYKREYKRLPQLIAKSIAPRTFFGCSAGGLIGGGLECEEDAALSLTAAWLPGVDLTPFHIEDKEMPGSDDAPDSWETLVGVKNQTEPAFILLPDPFSVRTDTLLQGLDYAFPKSVKIGGLASGSMESGGNALFLDRAVHHRGVVGLALDGDVIVDTVVAQGCRPIGKPMRMSKCEGNFLFELDGKPAVTVLKEVLDDLDEDDQKLARNALFLGVLMNEFKDAVGKGDFLVRNILGIVPKSGALVVGETLRPERTVQFHLRDAATSADDIRAMLKRYRDMSPDGQSTKAEGALLFSCQGRGAYLYDQENHDSNCFQEYLGPIPLGGFFCNGEIGPVGGTTFIHGYTSSFGIFRNRQPIG